MASTDIRVSVTGLREFAWAMDRMGRRAYYRSQRKAVTFIAKDYSRFKTSKVAQDIDRPTRFTRRAYDWDGDRRQREIFSRAFVRPKQARYLGIVETGGVRQRAPGGAGPLGPKRDVTDRFGGLYGRSGLKRRFFDRASQPLSTTSGGSPRYRVGAKRYAVLNLQTARGQIHGIIEKKKMSNGRSRDRRGRFVSGQRYWRTRLIARFMDRATYKPQLGFARDARTYARQRFPALSLRLFNEELRRALQR